MFLNIDFGVFPETPDSMIVTWSTWNATETAVHFGLTPNNLEQQVTGSSFIFEDGGQAKKKQFIHTATITPLTPNTEYCKFSV